MSRDSRATPRVLVSAGAEKQSLAAVRSLGRAGFSADVLNSRPDAPAFRSRWCNEGIVSPSNLDAGAYVRFLLDRVRRHRYVTVLACDDLTATCLSQHREAFARHTRLALPAPGILERATDKAELVRLSTDSGIPVPRTLHPQTRAQADRMASELGLPLILTGAHGWGAQHVRLVQRVDDLGPYLEQIAALEDGRLPMMQEFVPGVGYGFSTLFRHGQARALFMHRRASEYDVRSGGAPYSCPMAESVDEPELRRHGLTLFEALGWHGLGMAEWRRDTRNGRFVLMEINPRLVGSTDLAIRCGVDLPVLACRMLLDGDVPPVLEYPTGVRMRWLLPDALRDLLARPRQAFRQHLGGASSDWCWRDLMPHWMQLRIATWELRHAGRRGTPTGRDPH
ncbi:MAG: ATP-grasp domain-containing protein [Candidatus Krumholzibacteriia bacterium]